MTESQGEAQSGAAPERQHVVDLAFRMFGLSSDAEAVVQQTYARWYRLSDEERANVAEPSVWLTNVAARMCLDILGSRQADRDRYVGEWLPEPVPDAAVDRAIRSDNPLETITLDDSVSMALLVMLESLTAAERVAFVLHDIFGVPFDLVADIVGRTPSATRRLASSARRRAEHQRSPETSHTEHNDVVRAFRHACETDDRAALAALLSPSVTALTDSGGKVTAEAHPIHGINDVARLIHTNLARPDLAVSEAQVNGRTGLVARRSDEVVAIVCLNVREGQVTDVWVILNPDKLRRWNGR